jgi:hypothetical protein
MADFEKMYKKMFQASEDAINLLIAAQRECEEIFISQPEPNLKLSSLQPEEMGNTDEE